VPVLAASRVTVVAGKGGVGKTTVTAVLARSAARAGLRVVVVELDGKPVLAELVGDLPVEVISAPAALEQYLQDHGFGRIARRLSASGVIEVVGTAAPGIDDIVVLGKIKQLERSGDWDVVLVDGPAAGHAVTFLTSAVGLQRTVRGGPVRTQADDVVELLRDPARCQVMLVTLPETTPVNELVETAYALEDKVGVHLGPVVVNAVDRAGSVEAEVPDPEAVDLDVETVADRDALRAAAAFRSARLEMQAEELQRLGQELALDQLHVPLVPTAGMTAGDIDALADAIECRADGERA
jgi:anion-transporting  ArsA/GET3 family ATPase